MSTVLALKKEQKRSTGVKRSHASEPNQQTNVSVHTLHNNTRL